MHSTDIEANYSYVSETCLGADAHNAQIISQQLENIYLKSFGLDFLVDEDKHNVLHILAANTQFDQWDAILNGFVYLDNVDINSQTPLFVAVQNKNITAIKYLIENGANPTIADMHEVNSIELACQTKYTEGFKEILKSSIAQSYIGTNIIRMTKTCIESNSFECFKLLVKILPPGSINTVDDQDYTIIHHLVLANKPEFLRVLLNPKRKDIDVNMKIKESDKVEKTAIELAQSVPVAEILYARGCAFNKKTATPVITETVSKASQWQQTGRCCAPSEIHKYVMEQKIDSIIAYKGKVDIIDVFGKTPLLCAIALQPGQDPTLPSRIVKELINKNADPNLMEENMKYTAFHYAAKKGKAEALRSLLRYEPNFSILDSQKRSMVVCAIMGGSLDCLQILLSKKPNLSNDTENIQESLLNAFDPDTAGKMADLLIKSGFDMKAHTKSGKHLLRAALDAKCYKLADTLIKNGFLQFIPNDESCLIDIVVREIQIIDAFAATNVNYDINYNGRPLIHYTCDHKYDKIRNTMLEKQPNLKSAVDPSGNLFIHRACMCNNVYSIEDAINKMNNDVNARNLAGDTPLLLLVTNSSPDFEKNYNFLIEKGADIKAENSNKQNIFHILAKHNNIDATNYLLSENVLKDDVIQDLLSRKDSEGRTPLEAASLQRSSSQQTQDSLSTNPDSNVASNFSTINSNPNKNNDNPMSSWSSSSNTEHQAVARAISRWHHMPIFDIKPITKEAVLEHISRGYSVNIYNKDYPLLSVVIDQYESDKEGTIETVKTILSNKHVDPSIPDISPNEQYNMPLMPIHHALLIGSVELTSMLIEAGANFIVDPVVHCVAEDTKNEELMALVKLPERRASAILEIYETQNNAFQIIGAILDKAKKAHVVGVNKKIDSYLAECKLMYRLLSMFVQRLSYIYFQLTPKSEIGNFLVYFADAFLPLLGMSANYEVAISEIRSIQNLQSFLHMTSYGNLSIDDALIVPTQQFTRYPDLIKAVIKVTPKEHSDTTALQKALIKYSYIGKTSNERKLIAESQKELKLVRLITTIYDNTIASFIDDILFFRGQFELKEFSPPEGLFAPPRFQQSPIQNGSTDWGLKTYFNIYKKDPNNELAVTCYHTYGKSIESFLKKSKIAIFLFKNSTLFGLQKSAEKFKIKFSCRSTEVLWDFGKDYGMESVKIYTPFGSMLLKCAPPKGTLPNFERNRWRSDVDKILSIDEADEASPLGVEICYASWVGEQSKCVHSKTFHVVCNNKTEAREKILKRIEECGCYVLNKTDPLGQRVPMINYDFQTLKRNEGQKSEIYSDIPFN